MSKSACVAEPKEGRGKGGGKGKDKLAGSVPEPSHSTMPNRRGMHGGSANAPASSPWRNDADARTIAELQKKVNELEKGGAEVAMDVDGQPCDDEDKATAAIEKQLQYLGERIAMAKKFDDDETVAELEKKQKDLREQKAKAKPPRARAQIAERKLRAAEGKLRRAKTRVEETAYDLEEAQKAAEAAAMQAAKLADEVAVLQLEHYTASREAMAGQPMLTGGGSLLEVVITADDFPEAQQKTQLEDPTMQPFIIAIHQKYQAALAAQAKAMGAWPDGQARLAHPPTSSQVVTGTACEKRNTAGGAAGHDAQLDELDEEAFNTIVDTELLQKVSAAGTEEAQRKLLFEAMRSKAVARRSTPYS